MRRAALLAGTQHAPTIATHTTPTATATPRASPTDTPSNCDCNILSAAAPATTPTTAPSPAIRIPSPITSDTNEIKAYKAPEGGAGNATAPTQAPTTAPSNGAPPWANKAA